MADIAVAAFDCACMKEFSSSWASVVEFFLAGLFQQYYVKQSQAQVGQYIRGASWSSEEFELPNVQQDLL